MDTAVTDDLWGEVACSSQWYQSGTGLNPAAKLSLTCAASTLRVETNSIRLLLASGCCKLEESAKCAADQRRAVA